MNRPLRRTRADLIATAAIAAVSVVAVAGVWATAPIRSSHLEPATGEFLAAAPLTQPPTALTPVWERAISEVPGVHRAVTVDGVVISPGDRSVVGVDPATGEQLWSYTRDLELCSLGAAWGRAVTTWRAGNGCGDVVSIDADEGRYQRTRSAISPDQVVPVASNDRIGTIGAERLELWRSDMVRTVEYGEVEGRQEPDLQPHPGCRLTSALTRVELLAVTEVCEDGTWLRFQEATPESSREPEIRESVLLDAPAAHLVAVGEEGAVVRGNNELISYRDDGSEVARVPADLPLPGELSDGDLPYSPVTADLPHHLSWFDGERLVLFSPVGLAVQHVFPEALGPGVAVGERLLMPVADGIAVVNWESGETENTIPVDRGDHDGMVSLTVAGATVVEKRGGLLVGLA